MFQNLVWHASSHLQTSDMNASSELGFSWERLQLVAVSDQPALAFWDGWGWGCVGQIKMLSSTWRCAPFKNVVIWKTRVCETLVYIGCGRGKKQLPTQPHDTGVHLGYVLQPCVEYLLVLSLWACLFFMKEDQKGSLEIRGRPVLNSATTWQIKAQQQEKAGQHSTLFWRFEPQSTLTKKNTTKARLVWIKLLAVKLCGQMRDFLRTLPGEGVFSTKPELTRDAKSEAKRS